MYQDLNFFHDENSVFENLNFTKTESGKNNYIDLLSNYTDDLSLLNKRQTIIKEITNINSQEILNYIENIQNVEKDIYWLFEKKDEEFTKLLNSIYFKYEWLNHGWILSMNCNYKMYISVFISLISPLISIVVPYLILYYYGFKMNFWEYIKLTRQSYKLLSTITIGNQSNIIRYITNTLMVFSYFSNLSSTYDNSKKYKNIVKIIKNKINNIEILLVNTLKIKKLDNFSDSNCKVDIKKIKELIGTNIIENKSKYLYLFKNIEKYKDNIFNLLKYVGNIDMYISISKLLNNNFNFAKYSNLDIPEITCKKLFHPNLKNNISNDIHIKNDIILTGPNQSGKSVFMKSVITCIILAQTIGLVPALECNFTPFSYLNTYLNIPDNLGTSSLFEEEVNRCVKILDSINKLKTSSHSFVIMDEIFTSTSISEGLSISFSFCNEICESKNSLFIITSHFKYLTTIKRLDKYKTLINYDKQNNPIFTYKIIPGISKDKIAIKLLANKMNNNIINNAVILNNKFSKKFNKY
jgi:DNA mismatch repair ATPase MutS